MSKLLLKFTIIEVRNCIVRLNYISSCVLIDLNADIVRWVQCDLDRFVVLSIIMDVGRRVGVKVVIHILCVH